MKSSKIKKLTALCMAVLLIAALTGCGSGSAGSPAQPGASSPAGEPSPSGGTVPTKVYKFGASDSMTGTGAPYGMPGIKGIDLAVEQINNDGGVKIGNDMYRLEVVSYDNKSDAGESVSTVQKLVDIDKVSVILGWSSSTSTIAAVQTLKNQPVTMIVGNARSPEVLLYATGNVFRSATVNYYNPIADCEYIKSLGISKVAMFCFFNDSGYSGHVNNVIKAFESIGVEVVAKETMNAGETDFLSQMTIIKNSGAQGVYMAGNIEESALGLRQLRELGSKIPMFTFSSGTGPQWLKICTNEQMSDCYSIRPAVADVGPNNKLFNDSAEAFIKAYVAKYGENPSQTATNTYDNVWILKAALEHAGSTDWAAVNKALKEITVSELDSRTILPYEATDGKLFDAIGQSYHPYSVLKWDSNYQNGPGEPSGNWNFETLIGMNLGPDFHHDYMVKLAKDKNVADFDITGYKK